MTTLTQVRLVSNSPYHFGRRGVGLNETEIAFAADGFFSALCNALQSTEGTQKVSELLAQFPTVAQPALPPPFRLTSLLPCVTGLDQNGSVTRQLDLLPMPLLIPKIQGLSIETRKRFKKIAWLSRTVFQALIRGQEMANDVMLVEHQAKDRAPQPWTVQKGSVWVSKTEQEWLGGEDTTLWQVDKRPRVTVDRQSTAATPFSSGSVHFARKGHWHAGLYCLLRWEQADSDLQKRIKTALLALGDSGIGGERSYGYGRFQPEFTDIPDDLGAQTGNFFTILSPYLPQPGEFAVFTSPARWQINLQRGWISQPGYNHYRRPTVRMLESGAVLCTLANSSLAGLTGCLADATPDALQGNSKIYRYGLAWPVRVADQAITGEGANDGE